MKPSNKPTLNVLSLAYSLQGEGFTSGVPAYVVELCDEGVGVKFGYEQAIKIWDGNNQGQTINHLKMMQAHLIFKGGEVLKHQLSIISFCDWFLKIYKFLPVVEVETQGMVVVDARLTAYVTYWNATILLENSGLPYIERINQGALFSLCDHMVGVFKFEVQEKGDIEEILQLINDDFIQRGKVLLMPKGDTLEEVNANRPTAIYLAKRYGLKYTERLHLHTDL